MARKIAFLAMTILVAMTILLSACGGSNTGNKSITTKATAIIPAPPRGITGTISTGASIESSPILVTPEGGSFTLDQPDSPLKGIVIDVSPGSYTDNRNFKISYAPIQKHTFGEAFNPLTPLIKVDNGGGLSNEIMEVTIPVKVPADSFAMGFIYDEKTNTLEGLPTLAQDANSITVGTRHFTDIVISYIAESLLKKDIDSGFRPGIDDWQFTNYGSYIAKGGHCTGQSMTSMWYYEVQPDGKGLTLYGRYDNNGDKPATPALWQDDSMGYRFSSVVWKEMDWGSWGRKMTEKYAAKIDAATFKMFQYTMQLTGQPQMTEIWNTQVGGGHAMVVYRIFQNNLYIADPNYPANTDRRIEYKDGKFVPYNSGENAEEIANGNGKAYDSITYVAKTSLTDWNSLSTHWAELKAGTVGNGIFPNYQIEYKGVDGKYTELKDGYVSPDKLIDIAVSSNTPDTAWAVYRDGVKLKRDANGNYELLSGINKLGIYVVARVDALDQNNNPIKVAKYVDFKYINVEFQDNQCKSPPPKEILEKLQKTTTFKCELLNLPTTIEGQGSMNRWVPGFKFTKHFYVPGNVIAMGGSGAMAITWSGTSFSGGGSEAYPDKLTGNVCYNNGKLMVSFDYATNDPKDNLTMSVKNVPCDPQYFMDPKYAYNGKSMLQYMNTEAPIVKNYVTTLEWNSHEELPAFDRPPEVWDAKLTAKDWSTTCGFGLTFD